MKVFCGGTGKYETWGKGSGVDVVFVIIIFRLSSFNSLYLKYFKPNVFKLYIL